MPSDERAPAWEEVREPTGRSMLSMSDAKYVVHNQTEIARHLPAPRCAWRWSEVGLSRETLEELRRRDLIEQCVEWESRWQTTTKLWNSLPRYVDDQNPGTVAGQVRRSHQQVRRRTRVEGQRPDAPGVDAQATLGGGAQSLRAVREVCEERDNEDDAGKLGMIRQAGTTGEREVPDDQQTIADAVEEVGGTVPTTYHPEVHRAASHPAQQTLSEVSAP